MDQAKRERDSEERAHLRQEIVDDSSGILSYIWPFRPMKLAVDLVWAILRLFKPLAPHLVPLAVFSATLPLILFLSFGSGYLVWKSVAVSWETELFLQYGDGGSPYAEVALPSIVAQQPYDISIHLVVPANQANIALGNFMATLTLVTPSNNTIITTRKPAIVVAPLAAPWSYLSNRPGTVDINILMLSDYVVTTSRAIARVELGRRDRWTSLGEGHARELAVMEGTIRGAVIRHGLRGMIGQYPLISAVFASGTFFFILFVGLVVCLMPIVEWHFPPEIEEPRPMEPEDKPRKRRRSRRPDGETRPKTPTAGRREGSSSSRSQQREQDFKAENEEAWEYAPAASMGTTSGTTAIREASARRRTSRHSDDVEL